MKNKFILFLLILLAALFMGKCENSQNISSYEQNNSYETFSSEIDSEVSVSENTNDNITDVYSLPEEEFKNMCIEVTYNDLNTEWIGKYVTKEILFTSSEQNEYKCASTESYIEDYSDYQKTYAIYDIFDCRFDKTLPIYSYDVIKIYGVITDIKMNHANGLYYPVINMYYADYIREWGKSSNDSKSVDDLIQERIAEKERIAVENEYFNFLNSDYTGQTKNIADMELLSENEFKEKCDSMNFKNIVDSTEDLSGRYVKIHIKLTDHKIFTTESGKRNCLGDLVDKYKINDNVWYGKLFYERTEEYIGNFIWLYFVDDNDYDLESLKENQELTVYGMILNYKINNGYHNNFDFLVVYIE